MSLWRRRGRSAAALRQATQLIDEALVAGPQSQPRLAEVYSKAVRIAIDIDPGLCLSLLRRVDARIPPELYPAAFSVADADWLGSHAGGDDKAVLTVVFEIATRVGLVEIQRTARDRLADWLGKSGDAPEIVGYLTHWLAVGVADRETLTRVLQMCVGRAPLRDQAPVWTAFLRRLPDELLPDVFDVHELLDKVGPAVRLADTPERVRRVLALCQSSPDLRDVETGVALARRAGDPDALRGLLSRAGDVALASDRVEQALAFFSETGDSAGRSACLERLGRPFEALDGCTLQRLPILAEQCQRQVDDAAGRGDLDEAVRRCRQVLVSLDACAAEVASDGDGTAVFDRRRESAAALRALLEVARRRFRSRLAAGEDTTVVLGEWCRLEEEADEPAAAAELAEQFGDLYRAHRLYYQAGRFGEAERVLRADGSQAGLSARAQARAAGGDPRGAARLRDSAGDWDVAADLFIDAGDHTAAVDCLLRHRGAAGLTDPRLVAGLRRIGDLDRLAEICLRVVGDGKSPSPDDGRCRPPERAGEEEDVEELRQVAVTLLRSLPGSPGLSARLRTAVDGVLAHLDGPRRSAFETRAQALVARARADVDDRFAAIWGFDLGTTTCAAAIYDTQAGRAVLCPWKGRSFFPSTLSVDAQGCELVGLTAEEALAGWIVGQVSGSKLRLGRRTVYRVRERTYRPEEVTARLVRHGRTLVEGYLTDRVRERLAELTQDEWGEVPDSWLDWAVQHHDSRLDRPRALLTVPAYSLNNAKHATRDACEVAGVEVVRLIHEPTAACVTAARERSLSGRVVVVDLGAGTLDLSALDVGDGVYHVQHVLGNNRFGGNDLDAVVTGEILADLSRRGYQLPTKGIARRRVGIAAEYLKIALSGQEETEYALVGLIDGDDVTVRLTRPRLAELLAESFEQLSAICARLRQSLPEPPEHLVLVGGPMLSPMVRHVVEQAFDLPRTPVPDPRTAVAYGAALQAAVLDHRLDEVLLLDVTPLPLGVRIRGEDGGSELSVLIEANTTIPTEEHHIYTTVDDQQSTVTIEVFNGRLDPEARIAVFDLEGIAPAPAGEPQIDVRFAVDANCVLEVTARDLGTGRSRSVRITDSTLLSPTEVAALAQRQQEQADREHTWRRLAGAVAEAEAIDVATALSEFSDRLATHRPGRASLPPQTEQALVRMYRERGQVEEELIVLRDPLRDLLAAGRRVLDDEDTSTAGYVLEQLEAILTRLRPTLQLLDSWTAVLVAAAVADPDPLVQFQARYAAGQYARALDAVPELPSDADPDDVERYLHCLAETAEADQYLAALVAHGEAMSGVTRTGRNRDRYSELLAAAVVAVHGPEGPPDRRGLGVVVGKRLVLTTRRALTGGDSPRAAVPSAAAARVSVVGIEWSLERIILPEADVVDLALLVLAELPSGLDEPRPLRLGYSGLVRVGDLAQTLIPVPQANSTPDRSQQVDGTVERFEPFPELGLRLMRIRMPTIGPCGAPVVNAAGELVGLLTRGDGDGIFAIATDNARSLLDRV